MGVRSRSGPYEAVNRNNTAVTASPHVPRTACREAHVRLENDRQGPRPRMARLEYGGIPPLSRALRVSYGNGLRPPLTAEPLYPLRSEKKGQAGACPDRTRAILCTVRVVTGRGRAETDPGSRAAGIGGDHL